MEVKPRFNAPQLAGLSTKRQTSRCHVSKPKSWCPSAVSGTSFFLKGVKGEVDAGDVPVDHGNTPRLWEPPQLHGSEMAVEPRGSGPGSRVVHPPTVDILAVELPMMNCITKASSGGSVRPIGPPVWGGQASTPEGSSGGRPWVGLEAPRRFRTS